MWLLPHLQVAGLGTEGLPGITVYLLDCEKVQKVPEKGRDGFVDWGMGGDRVCLSTGVQVFEYLNSGGVLVFTNSVSALMTTLILLYCSLPLTARW